MTPYRLGRRLDAEQWRQVKPRAMFECCKWDIQSGDHCVLADFPLLLDQGEWHRISALAETLSREALEAERELLERPELHGTLGIPRALRHELHHGGPGPREIARVMRFDFHFTDVGWKISEVNADVPGGFVEASGFTRLMSAGYAGTILPPDPAEAYAEALVTRLGTNAAIAMMHATAYSDDRQVMEYLGKKIAARGPSVAMAGPQQIVWEHGRAILDSGSTERPLDAVVRFFPAEWLPNLRHKSSWLAYFRSGQTYMSNPATALLVQSKRFPLTWRSLSTNLSTWNQLLPQSVCPSDLSPKEFDQWVVKPALGRVGEDVGVPGVTKHGDLQKIYKAAKRHSKNWIAQRRFQIVPASDEHGACYPCIGVFTIDGRTAGAYGRIARTPLIDQEAQDIAVLLVPPGGNA